MKYSDENHFALFQLIADAAGSKVHNGKGFQYYYIDGFIWPNLIFNTPFHKEKALDTLGHIHKKIQHESIPNLLICSPPSMPASGLDYLKQHYKKYGYWTAMYIHLDRIIEPIHIPSLKIKRAQDKTEIQEWCGLLSSNSNDIHINEELFYNMAKNNTCRFYTAYIDHKAVATCWAHHYKNSLGLYAISTHKNYCGRGIASEITKHAMQIAKNEQLDAVFLQATDAAISLYNKIGFLQAGQLEVFDLSQKNH